VDFHHYNHIGAFTLGSDEILVFGSNTEGRHGAGLALVAKLYYGAEYGNPSGLQGKSYALVTKNLTHGTCLDGYTFNKAGRNSVPRTIVQKYIKELYKTAIQNPQLNFIVPYIVGKENLNGYNSEELFHMFISEQVPENIIFHISLKILFRRFRRT
jgi:hypothetical protein